jgi:hypothetical protein
MARIRYLKPDFFKDEDVAGLEYWVRLLFQGLWGIADRAGRLEDRPSRIKAELFPYDSSVDVEQGLQILGRSKCSSRRPFIIRYEADGQKYIQIVKWHKHQKPHHTERESKIPPPPGSSVPVDENKVSDVGYADKANGEENEKGNRNREGNGEYSSNGCEVNKPLGNGELKGNFDRIWEKYPSKINKAQAFNQFRKSVQTPKDLEDIETALENYIKSKRVRDGYVQDGGRWFDNWREWVDFKDVEKNLGFDYSSGAGYSSKV